MQRNLTVVGLCLAAACLFGCAKESQESPDTPSNVVSPHGAGSDTKQSDQSEGFIGIVTSQKLPISNARTIGTAFDEYRYFSSRDWKETRNAAGRVYVDFKGLFATTPASTSVKDGVSRQGVEVKFVVEPNGNFHVGMISRIDVTTDGKMYLYPLGDGKKIVEMIYDNKEIKF